MGRLVDKRFHRLGVRCEGYVAVDDVIAVVDCCGVGNPANIARELAPSPQPRHVLEDGVAAHTLGHHQKGIVGERNVFGTPSCRREITDLSAV